MTSALRVARLYCCWTLAIGTDPPRPPGRRRRATPERPTSATFSLVARSHHRRPRSAHRRGACDRCGGAAADRCRSTLEPAEAHPRPAGAGARGVRGAPIRQGGACEADLCGDAQPIGIGPEGLAYEILGHERAVGVGGVDEIDAELHRPSEDSDGGRRVGGGTPDARAGELHRAEAQSMNGELAEAQRARLLDRHRLLLSRVGWPDERRSPRQQGGNDSRRSAEPGPARHRGRAS